MNTERLMEDMVKAQDLENLLEHIAWDTIIAPELDKYKDICQNLLVSSVLGQPLKDHATGDIISKEMIAGRIEGINWIKRYLTNILRRGEQSQTKLEGWELQ